MLTALDWLIIAIVIGGLIRGYMVGAIRQIASLLGLVVAFLFSIEFMEVVGHMVVSALNLSDSVAPLAGFTVLFLGIYLVFLILSRVFEEVLRSLSLSVVNRTAGGAVGGFKAALLLSLLFLVLTRIDVPSPQSRRASALYGPVAHLLPWTIEVAEDWYPAARRAADQLGKEVKSDGAPAQQTSISIPDSSAPVSESDK